MLVGIPLLATTITLAACAGSTTNTRGSSGAADASADARQSIRGLDRQLRGDPQNVTLLTRRAALKRDAGDLEGALGDIDEAMFVQPDDVRALRVRAAVMHDMGDHTDALIDADRAIALDPQHTSMYLLRSDIRTAMGDHDRSMVDLDTAISLEPDLAELYSVRAAKRMRAGDQTGALEDANEAVRLAPGPDSLFMRAQFRIAALQYAAAEADLNDLITADDSRPEAYIRRAWLAVRQGQNERAVTDLVRAIDDLGSQNPEAFDLRGYALLQGGAHAEAIADLERAVQIAGETPERLLYIGAASTMLGQRERAEQSLIDAINAAGDDWAEKDFAERWLVRARSLPQTAETADAGG